MTFDKAKAKILAYFSEAAMEWERLRYSDYELAKSHLCEKLASLDILRLIEVSEVEIERAYKAAKRKVAHESAKR
jgi:hypothetical protein